MEIMYGNVIWVQRHPTQCADETPYIHDQVGFSSHATAMLKQT